MPEQIYIGNIAQGLTTNRPPFVIDNDAFPDLYNAYVWRGRIKKKRGTILLNILERQLQIATLDPTMPWLKATFNLDGAGNANLIMQFTLEPSATITPGQINLTIGGQLYTDPLEDGTLQGNGGGTGTINYATGDIHINAGAGLAVTGTFAYYPGLPVMGLRDFIFTGNLSIPSQGALYPFLLAFDTTYSYQITQANPSFYTTDYYKFTQIPFTWSAGDANQFWTTNYEFALWATNNKPGFHFKPLDGGVDVTRISATQVTMLITTSGLIPNDVVWINEVTGTIGTGTGTTQNQNINGQTGYVVSVVGNVVTVNFDGTKGSSLANFQAGATGSAGIAQYLTNSIAGQDGIKWYDGDPTGGTGIPTSPTLGWVNFAPPLSATGQSIESFTSTTPFYLVGALAIVAFKDRLLFFSPYIQTAAPGSSPKQLQDVVIWSQNGSPYYTATVPTTPGGNFGFAFNAYFVDQTGLGGYLSAGIAKPIITVANNEDVILVGFGGTGRKTRFVYTGNDLQPFLFYNINSELPSTSTFSAIVMDKGAIDIGIYGITMTDQQSCQRIDLLIPDQVFEIQAANLGSQRVNAIRDFFKEWIYFCYPVNNSDWKFPTQSLLYNYRDNTWSILYENYTTHGTYRSPASFTWATCPYATWRAWNVPWNSGSSYSKFPQIIAGNPQGYVLIKDESLFEAPSGTIMALSNDGFGNTQITSINHCVDIMDMETGLGDYLLIQGVLGLLNSTITAITPGTQTLVTTVNTFAVGDLVTISGVVGMTNLNDNTYLVVAASPASVLLEVDSTDFPAYVSGGTVTSALNGLVGLVTRVIDINNFVIDIPFPLFTTIYLGLGTYARLTQPLIKTKQFAPYWDQGRQMRLSAQRYLLDRTANGQITLDLYLSQDPGNSYNDPDIGNGSLIYSQLLYTCQELQNLGLTPANVNLQMPTGASQSQIWHRFNTSLIGDSVQIGFTLSNDSPGAATYLEKDSQMRDVGFATSEVTIHGIHLTADKGPMLA